MQKISLKTYPVNSVTKQLSSAGRMYIELSNVFAHLLVLFDLGVDKVWPPLCPPNGPHYGHQVPPLMALIMAPKLVP